MAQAAATNNGTSGVPSAPVAPQAEAGQESMLNLKSTTPKGQGKRSRAKRSTLAMSSYDGCSSEQAQLPATFINLTNFSFPGTRQNSAQSNAATTTKEADGTLREDESDGNSPTGLANTKEKTPMCLVNELARFNKIQHLYTLTDEQGPAHKKTFYVKLKLGDEEYSASGASIKSAQHAAAAVAMDNTQYRKPPVRTGPKIPFAVTAGPRTYVYPESVTPTVELNALAMKRGEPAVYRPLEPPHTQSPYPFRMQLNYDYRMPFSQRFPFARFPRHFHVQLEVGQRKFLGEGPTRQAARHDAASKALRILKVLPLPSAPAVNGTTDVQGPDVEYPSPGDSLKSEISQVHEIALRRQMSVTFEVIKESGPPHMKTFITRVTCGDIVCDGEGNSKKLSKKKAAEKLLEQLIDVPPSAAAAASPKPKKSAQNKKKNRSLIKVFEDADNFQQEGRDQLPLGIPFGLKVPQLQKASVEYGQGINPISRLIQIQQAKKEKEPVYNLVDMRGVSKRREFVMEVVVAEHKCTGVGPNKKLAKRNAAEAMLITLGYSRPMPKPQKPAIKSDGNQQVSPDKKVTFMDPDSARSFIPGVIVVPRAGVNGQVDGVGRPIGPAVMPTVSVPVAGVRFAVHDQFKPVHGATSAPTVLRPKQQLQYLSELMRLQIQFTDFPKGANKTECLSLVSLSTNPPQVCHGTGPTFEASHDNASRVALSVLAQLGIGQIASMPPVQPSPTKVEQQLSAPKDASSQPKK